MVKRIGRGTYLQNYWLKARSVLSGSRSVSRSSCTTPLAEHVMNFGLTAEERSPLLALPSERSSIQSLGRYFGHNTSQAPKLWLLLLAIGSRGGKARGRSLPGREPLEKAGG